jgi:hypothetical protein
MSEKPLPTHGWQPLATISRSRAHPFSRKPKTFKIGAFDVPVPTSAAPYFPQVPWTDAHPHECEVV